MNAWLQIAAVVIVAVGWFMLVMRAKPRRDVCKPLTNEERLLSYIDRRSAWECEHRKRKLLQRQRVERMLELRYLDRRFPTVPAPLAQREAA